MTYPPRLAFAASSRTPRRIGVLVSTFWAVAVVVSVVAALVGTDETVRGQILFFVSILGVAHLVASHWNRGRAKRFKDQAPVEHE
jgi:steroid 5-alpha reductase family enzyme